MKNKNRQLKLMMIKYGVEGKWGGRTCYGMACKTLIIISLTAIRINDMQIQYK